MLGVLVLGVFGGVVLAGRLNRPIPQPVPAPVRVVQPTAPVVEPTPAPVPEVAVVAPPTTAEPVVDPAPTAAEPNGAGGHAHSGHRTTTTAARPPAGGITPEQAAANARAVAAALGQGGGPSGPVNSTRLPAQSSGAQENSPGLSGAARNGRAVRAFQDARVVANCWQMLLRQNPAVRDSAVRVTLSVNGQGRFTSARVSGSPDPRFDTCVSSGAGRVAPIGAGESFDTVISVSLTTGG